MRFNSWRPELSWNRVESDGRVGAASVTMLNLFPAFASAHQL